MYVVGFSALTLVINGTLAERAIKGLGLSGEWSGPQSSELQLTVVELQKRVRRVGLEAATDVSARLSGIAAEEVWVQSYAIIAVINSPIN